MTPIVIQAGEQSYEVLVGSRLLEKAGALLAQKLSGPDCAIVSDDNVAALFAEPSSAQPNECWFQAGADHSSDRVKNRRRWARPKRSAIG